MMCHIYVRRIQRKHVILQTNKLFSHKIPHFEWFYAIQKLRIAFHLIILINRACGNRSTEKYLLLIALSRRRREVNHVSFACAIPHVIIKCVA